MLGIVVRADGGKDAVYEPERRAGGGHEDADLRHENDQGDLADVGRFSRHVGSGNDGGPELFAVQVGVVRDEFFVGEILIEHRVAAVFQAEAHRLIQRRTAVMTKPRRLGQRPDDV